MKNKRNKKVAWYVFLVLVAVVLASPVVADVFLPLIIKGAVPCVAVQVDSYQGSHVVHMVTSGCNAGFLEVEVTNGQGYFADPIPHDKFWWDTGRKGHFSPVVDGEYYLDVEGWSEVQVTVRLNRTVVFERVFSDPGPTPTAP